jgi:hypothetical protein
MNDLERARQHTDLTAKVSPGPMPYAYPLLLTENEVIDLLRIPEISHAENHHLVIKNLKRVHGLPCIHICKTPLYPFEAIRQWLLDKAERERQ